MNQPYRIGSDSVQPQLYQLYPGLVQPQLYQLYPGLVQPQPYMSPHNDGGFNNQYQIDLNVPPPGSREFEDGNLGNGFYRFAWENRIIGPNQILPVFIHAGDLKVINAGYGIQDLGNAILVESYPKDKNNWYMTVQNRVNAQRKIAFYLIAKK